MPQRRRRIWLLAAGILIASVAIAVLLLTHPQTELAAPAAGETLRNAAQGLDEIQIDATFDPLSSTLAVQQTLALRNRTGATQRLVVLRTYPNAMQSEEYSPAATDELYDACYPDGFSAGGLSVKQVWVQMVGAQGEQRAAYAYGDDAQTVLNLTLPMDWAQGDTLTLRLEYTLTVPHAAYRFGENGGIWAIGNAFAIPAPFVDGAYLTDEYISIGDPFISTCANYTVRLTLPDGYMAAGTGTAEVQTGDTGHKVLRLTALASRDFALCISAGYRPSQTLQDGVLVQAYARTDANAATLQGIAAKALHSYTTRFGAYPYPTLTVCEADFAFGGMEYPSLLMIGSEYLQAGGDKLEQMVAHEVAHQWWYAAVGNDQYRQAWQDEALAQFSMLEYWQDTYGRAARDDLQFALVETSMRVTIPQGVTPGCPIDYFGDLTEYGLVVYNRGAAALCALDTAMEGTLDGFLAEYYRTYAFALATRDDFETLLSRYTGEDWSPLLSDYLDTDLNN